MPHDLSVESGFVGKSLHCRTRGQLSIVANRPPRDQYARNRADNSADERSKKCPGDLCVDLKHGFLNLLLRRVNGSSRSIEMMIAQFASHRHDADTRSCYG